MLEDWCRRMWPSNYFHCTTYTVPDTIRQQTAARAVVAGWKSFDISSIFWLKTAVILTSFVDVCDFLNIFLIASVVVFVFSLQSPAHPLSLFPSLAIRRGRHLNSLSHIHSQLLRSDLHVTEFHCAVWGEAERVENFPEKKKDEIFFRDFSYVKIVRCVNAE